MAKALKLFFSLLFCLVSLTSMAQTLSNYQNSSGWAVPDFITESHVEGTRYLYDNFIIGTVYYDDFNKVAHLPLRFNLHNDEIEIVRNDSIYAFDASDRIDRILLEDEIFSYIDITENSDLSGFVKIWDFQFPTIVTKMKTNFVGEKHNPSYGFPEPARFVRKDDEHYLMKSENEAVRITSMEQLIYLLPYYSVELTDKLKEFAKQEQLSRKSGADLAKFLRYYQKLKSKSSDTFFPYSD